MIAEVRRAAALIVATSLLVAQGTGVEAASVTEIGLARAIPSAAQMGPPLSARAARAETPRPGPVRLGAQAASASCEPVVQNTFRWVSASIMANGLPIISYTSRRPHVPGGEIDEDGYLHPRVAAYLTETVIARPVVLEDSAMVGRSRGFDNTTAIDIATNGAVGLIIVTFIDPLRNRVVVRRSTDFAATWSPVEPLSTLSATFDCGVIVN